MTSKKTAFLCMMPQLLITFIFFIWPATKALMQSFYFSDAFGLEHHFAGFAYFIDLWHSPEYAVALRVSFWMAFAIMVLTMFFGLALALLVNSITKGRQSYKTLLLWPYAVAPAVAAILWRFLCHPSIGWVSTILKTMGFDFNYLTNAYQAMVVVILTASWQQFSYNFLFFFAALQCIPTALIDAAIIDGASSWQRFKHIMLPLLTPTAFFLLSMNLIYSFFDTFGIIQVLTHGGPGYSTTTLIYKIYKDGFLGMDPGYAAAQSVILMGVVILLILLQFHYLDKKVHYQ